MGERKRWKSAPEREYDRGYADASEPMGCGHPRCCSEKITHSESLCKWCQSLSDNTVEVMQARERDRLIAIARKAAKNVVPKATVDYLDGVQAGADIVVGELERST